MSLIGSRIGVYEVVSLLGAGGMGEVYRARDTKLGREVAIKVLPAAFAADADRLERFEREARALAALNHPHNRRDLRRRGIVTSRRSSALCPGGLIGAGLGRIRHSVDWRS